MRLLCASFRSSIGRRALCSPSLTPPGDIASKLPSFSTFTQVLTEPGKTFRTSIRRVQPGKVELSLEWSAFPHRNNITGYHKEKSITDRVDETLFGDDAPRREVVVINWNGTVVVDEQRWSTVGNVLQTFHFVAVPDVPMAFPHDCQSWS